MIACGTYMHEVNEDIVGEINVLVFKRDEDGVSRVRLNNLIVLILVNKLVVSRSHNLCLDPKVMLNLW